MSTRVTVVIPTYNRALYLERVLRALEHQDTPPGTFDVMVVDDGSSDGTSDVLRQTFTYRLTSRRQANGGPAVARNTAIQAAEGDLIVFIDDDVIPEPDLVRQHLAAHEDGAAGVVTGRMLLPEGSAQPVWAEWEGRALRRQYDDMIAGVFVPTPRQFYTANASVRRADLIRAGLFDPQFKRAEDVELAYRLADLGLTFRFVPEAEVVHDTPRSLKAWLAVADQYGRYDIMMWRDRGRSHILGNIAEELHYARNRAVRTVANAAVGRPLMMLVARAAARAGIRILPMLRLRKPALMLCSATFNLLYLDAACREFGGRRAFWSAIDRELRRAEPVSGASLA